MKIIRIIFLIFACIFMPAESLFAQKSYKVDDVPNVRLAGYGNAVSNPDGILSQSTVVELNHKLTGLQQQTSIEVAVVAIESIGEMPVEDFGIQLFRKWGIGKDKKDNGLLILLVTGDRVVRFEVGYGLEGVLTDALSKRIQTQRMMPFLKSNDWDGAAISAVDAVTEYLTAPDSDLRNEQDYMEGDTVGRWVPLIFILGAMALMIVGPILVKRRMMKCPRCGSQMKVVNSNTNLINRSTSVTTTTLKCPKCGYTTTRKTTNNLGSAIGGGIGGMLGGGGFGRGGGFSGGGSWGGGSAGGGGASTRF